MDVLIPIKIIKYRNKFYKIPETMDIYISFKNPEQYYIYSSEEHHFTELSKDQFINFLIDHGIISEEEFDTESNKDQIKEFTEDFIIKKVTELEEKIEQITSGSIKSPKELEKEYRKTIRYLKRLGISTGPIENAIERLILKYHSLNDIFEIAELPPIESITVKVGPNCVELPPRYMLAFKRALECFKETILSMYRELENPLSKLLKFLYFGSNTFEFELETIELKASSGLYKCEDPYLTMLWLYCLVHHLVYVLRKAGYDTDKIIELFERGRIKGNKIVL